MWRISDGMNMDIYMDWWFSDSSNPRTSSVCHPRLKGCKVVDLINHDNFDWNRDIINSCFNAQDSHLILSLSNP